MNIEVSNHMTTIEDDAVKKLDSIYKIKKTINTETTSNRLRKPVQQAAPTKCPAKVLKRMKRNK